MTSDDRVITHTLIERMASAAVDIVECMRVLSKSGDNLVSEVLGGAEFLEWEHYPPDDVYDPETHAQYYFHAHSPGDRAWSDYGHFHTFLREKGMPLGFSPIAGQESAFAAKSEGAISHLIAISVTREGVPVRLFTTNRWVTDETWYRAGDMIAMLDHFVMDLARPSWPLNRWISAMLVLFRPQIEDLLVQRDQAIAEWHVDHLESDVYEDRYLEITSSLEISLQDQVAWVQRLAEGNQE